MRLPRYRVIQQEWDRKHGKHNEPVFDFDDLVTHHPKSNQHAHLKGGVIFGGEEDRAHAIVGGEIQEIEIARNGRNFDLRPNKVLLKKDFILENSTLSSGANGVRDVDVPSPVAGYIGRVVKSYGLVDIYDREGGEVIARIRHMRPILVREGQIVEYGQALGTQSDQKAEAKHVHLEIDTRYHQQYENYISDLINGRLAIDPQRQSRGIVALPIFDDGTFRVGEANPRIQQFQEELISRGYSGAHGRPLRADGVYRLEMQPAVLAFQHDHGIVQTGDIDRSTLHIALPLSRDQVIDRMDHVERSRAPFTPLRSSDAPVRGFQPSPDDYLRQPARHGSEFERSQPSAAISTESQGQADPRDRNHPDHAMHEGVRTKLRDLYAEQGLSIDGEQLERLTAGVMADARRSQMTRVDLLEFSEDYDTGKADVNGNIIAFQGDPANPASPYSATTIDQAMRTPAEDSYRQFDTATQQQTQQWDRFFAQEQELSQSRGMHHSL